MPGWGDSVDIDLTPAELQALVTYAATLPIELRLLVEKFANSGNIRNPANSSGLTSPVQQCPPLSSCDLVAPSYRNSGVSDRDFEDTIADLQALRLSTVAQLLNVSQKTVQRLIDDGSLPAVRLNHQTVRVLVTDVRRFLMDHGAALEEPSE